MVLRAERFDFEPNGTFRAIDGAGRTHITGPTASLVGLEINGRLVVEIVNCRPRFQGDPYPLPMQYAEKKAMPKTTKPKDDLRYEPTKAELEEDIRIDAMPEELAPAMFGRHPRRVIH